jgi:signal transduction histidine kinase
MQVVRSVRTALLATTLLFASTLIVLRGASLWLERPYLLDRAEATTRNMTLILEEYAKRTFETSDHVLREIARYSRENGGAVSAHTEEALLQVVVRDNGRGFAANPDAAPRRGSLGSRVIETFAGQIGATTSYTHEGGTVFRMTVPKAGLAG